MTKSSNITPAQKKSLLRIGLLLTFAIMSWPLVHQIAMERIELEPGSFLNGLLKSARVTVPLILGPAMLFTLTRAIGIAEGDGAASESNDDQASAD